MILFAEFIWELIHARLKFSSIDFISRDRLRKRPLGPPFTRGGNSLMRTKNLLRLSACGATAAVMTYPGGSHSSDGTRRYVSVFGSSIATPDGTIYYDQEVARVDGSDVITYSDGQTSVLDTNFV